MSTRTEAGVPVPPAGELYPQRYAMDNPAARDLVARHIEEMGGFGAVTDNKKDKIAQRFFADKVAQMQGAQDAGIFQVA